MTTKTIELTTDKVLFELNLDRRFNAMSNLYQSIREIMVRNTLARVTHRAFVPACSFLGLFFLTAGLDEIANPRLRRSV